MRRLILVAALAMALAACEGDGSEPGPWDDRIRVGVCEDVCASHAPKERMCTTRCVESGWPTREDTK